VDRHDERDLATLDDLELAHGVADRAGLVAVAHFERGVTTESKPDSSPVTVADREVEGLLRAALSRARPLDAILGEEMGETGRSSRTWIVDPIDGTNFFARKDPNWRIQIALREDDEIILAVVDEPANGRRWWATAGGGAWERTTAQPGARQLRVSDTSDAKNAVLAFYPPDVVRRLPPHVQMEPRSALPLVEVVRGEIDGFFVDCPNG
jgi:fructose-1,6-bisphosphatase/inositol monophosphatase family enzyme